MIKINFSFKSFFIALLGVMVFGVQGVRAATYTASTLSEFKTAVSNATSAGDIVQLTGSFTSSESFAYSKAYTWTLDLNGNSIGYTSGAAYQFIQQKAGKLIIKDSRSGGRIYSTTGATSATNFRLFYLNGGDLEIQSGTIDVQYGSAANPLCAVRTATANTFTMTGGTITVTSGGSYTYGVYVNYSTSSATITGGTISVTGTSGKTTAAVYTASGSSTIGGGRFYSNLNSVSSGKALQGSGTYTISGGCYSDDYKLSSLVSGYKKISIEPSSQGDYNDGYRFMVIGNSDVARVKYGSTEVLKTSLSAAFTEAKTHDNSVITLLDNCSEATALTKTNAFTANYTYTLDLNNKTATYTGTAAYITIDIAATLIIKDNSTAGGGRLESQAAYSGRQAVVYTSNSSSQLQLDGGTLYAYNTTSNQYARAVDLYAGTFTMNGGHLHARNVGTNSNQTAALYVRTSGIANVYGGKLELTASSYARATSLCVHTVGTCTIEGGEFLSHGASGSMVRKAGGTCSITGGYYSNTNAYTSSNVELGTIVANGYSVQSNPGPTPSSSTYPYMVAEAPAGYTITLSVNTDGYGTVSPTTVSDVASGATLSQSTKYLKVNGSTVATATPTTETAQYTYTFTNYTKSDGTALPSTVTSDLAIRANFTRENRSYSVTLTTNGGTINAGDVTSYTYGTGATLPTNVTKTGYNFGGWYDNSGLTGSAVTTISSTATGDKQYWAKWTAKTYSITLHDNNGGSHNGSATATYNSTSLTSVSAPSRTGYEVEGYYTNAVCTTKVATPAGALQPSATYTNSSSQWTADGNRTLYTKWTEITHRVDVSAGTGKGTVSPSYVTGVGITTASGDITASPSTGYSFAGWSLPSGVTAASAYSSSSNPIRINATADSKTITATWSAINYNVTYSNPGNGNSYTISVAGGTPGSATKTANYGQTITLAASATTGYHFVSWTVTKAGGGTVTVTSNQFTMPAENVTVTATFALDTYAISYAAGTYGSGSLAGGTKTYGEAYTLSSSSSAFSRTGYTYDGWSTNEAGSSKDYTLGGSYTTNAAQTFYPHWVAKTCTVVFDKESGSGGSDNATATYDSALPSITAPSRTGYTFGGYWDGDDGTGTKYYNADGTSAKNWDKNTTSNTTLYAKWTINTYTVSIIKNYNAWGTISATSIESVPYGTAISASSTTLTVTGKTPVTATAADQTAQYTYGFNNWVKYDAGEYPLPETVTSDLTVRANFTRTTRSYTIRFLNYDGTVLQSTSVDYDVTPTYSGSTPTKPTDASYTYTFSGWSPTIASVTGAQDYTAQFSSTANVASVTPSGGSASYYTTFAAAFAFAKTQSNSTIKLLQSEVTYSGAYLSFDVAKKCTLDLNGKTLNGSCSDNYLLVVKNASAEFTITDSGSGGKFKHVKAVNNDLFNAAVWTGTLNIEGGEVYCQNTTKHAYAVASTGDATCHLNVTGGTVKAEASQNAAAVYAQNNVNTVVSGGALEATATVAQTVYILGNAKVTISGTPTISATSNSSSVARTVYAEAATAQAVISGGTFEATSGSADDAVCIWELYSGASVSISGGKFKTSGARLFEIVSGASLSITGGYFNESAGTTHKTQVANYCTGTKYPVAMSNSECSSVGMPNGSYKVIDTYTVTVDVSPAGYGSVSPTSIEHVPTGSSITSSSNTFTVNGTTVTATAASTTAQYSYAFSSWTNASGTVTSAKTVTANFTATPRTYTVTLTTNGGTINAGNVTSYTYGTGATLPTNVTKTGYEFAGWYDNSGLTGDRVYSITTSETGDKEYWAKWTPATLYYVTAGNWNTAANWSPACVPTAAHDVIIQKPCTVTTTDAVAKSVVIDRYSTNTGELIINANNGLNVTGTIQLKNAGGSLVATTPDVLFLGSSASGNASLIFSNPESSNNQAWVQMYSKADYPQDGVAKWQYVGTPFVNSTASPNYNGSWLYRWNHATGGWDGVSNANTIDQWIGYCLTQRTATTLNMEGTLLPTTESVSLNFPSGALVNTADVFANSWTAPIQLTQMDPETDFTNVTPTIYFFNTGTDSTHTGTAGAGQEAAGTYRTVSISAVGVIDELPSKISSMQGFYVKKANTASEAYVTLDYSKHVRPTGANTIDNGAMLAPRRTQVDRPEVMKIVVQGSRYGTDLYLLAREDFSRAYDLGWDGENINGAGAGPLLYTLREDGTKDAISAIPDYEGTAVGFHAGEDNEYTFSFTYNGDEVWYLNDLLTHTSTRISAANTYTFLTTDNDELRFIISATPLAKVHEGIDDAQAAAERPEKVLVNDKLYIKVQTRTYDATGKLVENNK